MKKRILLLLLTPFLFAGTTYNPHTGKFDQCTTIEETDGSPSNIICGKVSVSNGSLTDDGDGTYTLDVGGLGGPTLSVCSNTASGSCDYTCDGTADNVQIQAAIDALDADGGTVQLSEGTFTLAATVTITPDDEQYITLQGIPGATIITRADSMNDDAVQVAGSYAGFFAIRDIKFVGNKANNTAGSGINITGDMTSLDEHHSPRLTNLIIQEFDESGVELSDSGQVYPGLHITNVKSFENDLHGFELRGSDHFIINSVAGNNLQNGFLLRGANTQLASCKAFGNGASSNGTNYHGIQIANARISVYSSSIQENYTNGIYIGSPDATITGNAIDNNDNGNSKSGTIAGILLSAGADYSVISGNTFYNFKAGQNQKYGLLLAAGVEGCAITGNVMFDSQTTGLYAAAAELENNTFVGNIYESGGTNHVTFGGDAVFRNEINIQSGEGLALQVGADINAKTLTEATRKFGRFGAAHYHNAEEPMGLLLADSDGTDNIVSIGGGTLAFNSATKIGFYTAANDATKTGTEVMTLTNPGNLLIDGAFTVGNATGVSLTASDGLLTLLGLGSGGNNENLLFDLDISADVIRAYSGTSADLQWQVNQFVRDNYFIAFGDAFDSQILWDNGTVDSWQFGTDLGGDAQSGYITFMHLPDMGAAGREPTASWPNGVNPSDPTQCVASSDAATGADDVLCSWHDQTDGRIGVGSGNLKITSTSTVIGNGATTAGVLTLLEDTDDGANFASFMVPALVANTVYTLPPDDGDNTEVLQTDGSGVLTWVANAGGGAVAWDDIADPDNNGLTTIDFDNAAENSVFTTIYDAAGSFFTINNSDADIANQVYLLDLDYSADDDQALADYIKCQDAGGAVFTVQQEGTVTAEGTIQGEQITSTDDVTMAGLLTNTMAAADPKGLYIDGATNDYTAASTGITLDITRDLNVGTNNLQDYYGIQNILRPAHTGGNLNDSHYLYAQKNFLNSDETIDADQAVNKGYYSYVSHNYGDNNAAYDTSSTGAFNGFFYGENVLNQFNATFTDSGTNSPATSTQVYGVAIDVDNTPTLTSGALTNTTYGLFIDARGNAAGGSSLYAIHIAAAQGADSNSAIYDDSGADWTLDADSQKIYFGELQDGHIEHDGDSLNLTANSNSVTDTILLTGGALSVVTGATGDTEVVLPNDSIATAEILDNTITATDIAATVTLIDGDLLDLSAINASSTTEGIILPQANDPTSSTANGQLTWDNDNFVMHVGDGTDSIQQSFLIGGGGEFTATGVDFSIVLFGGTGTANTVGASIMCGDFGARVGTVPGGAATWTATLQYAAANTNVTCDILSGVKGCNDTAHITAASTGGDSVRVKFVAGGGPANVTSASWNARCWFQD